MIKYIVASENSIYHTKHLFVKIMKVQSHELHMMHLQGRTAAFSRWMIAWRQVLHCKTFNEAL